MIHLLDKYTETITNIRIFDLYSATKEKHPGPWCNEPDRMMWYLPDKEIVCVANRHRTLGTWCGYLGLPFSHRYINNPPYLHGGITYEDVVLGIYEHRANEREPDMWLGFDCSHLYDLIPFEDHPKRNADYKDLEYVVQELMSTAII